MSACNMDARMGKQTTRMYGKKPAGVRVYDDAHFFDLAAAKPTYVYVLFVV